MVFAKFSNTINAWRNPNLKSKSGIKTLFAAQSLKNLVKMTHNHKNHIQILKIWIVMTLCFWMYRFRAFKSIITWKSLSFMVFPKFSVTIIAWLTQDLKSKQRIRSFVGKFTSQKNYSKMAHKHKNRVRDGKYVMTLSCCLHRSVPSKQPLQVKSYPSWSLLSFWIQ